MIFVACVVVVVVVCCEGRRWRSRSNALRELGGPDPTHHADINPRKLQDDPLLSTASRRSKWASTERDHSSKACPHLPRLLLGANGLYGDVT